jgi:hypothetical protein
MSCERKSEAVPIPQLASPYWGLQEGESRQWHDRFLDYCALPSRTVSNAYRQHIQDTHGRTPRWTSPSWEIAARRFRWAERARAWDEDILAQKTSEWETRKKDIVEKEYQLGNISLQMADEIMVALKNSPDFMDTASTKDFERLALTGSKLTRMAAGLSTNRVEVSTTSEADIPVLLARRLIEDPDAIQRANELLERAANRHTSGDGLDG